ncbi:hypothetical protein ATANTOWER_010355 [Ataeniobius toweri]|uniref:Uncharacterized protein n=1 Tax=Ataeniobius toweri TaxID=208326 RepID=A0ABU7CCC9_9TELE|nr:hypothetical protein [Ataeniobius toweri]
MALSPITLPSCSPAVPPFHVNFMDLSANCFPPLRPSRMWHLQADTSQLLSFPVASPLGPSAQDARASAGMERATHHLVLLTLLAGVLLSSHVISEEIPYAHHQTADSVAISDLDYITFFHKLSCFIRSKYYKGTVILSLYNQNLQCIL